MIEEEVVGLLANLPGVVVITAGPENNAPEVSWGDSFSFYDPDGTSDRRQPFATIVTKDYPGFDTLSNLDRPGVFRLNLAVGRDVFERPFGFSPAQFADRAAEFDFAVPDRVIPHPRIRGAKLDLDPGAGHIPEIRCVSWSTMPTGGPGIVTSGTPDHAGRTWPMGPVDS